MSSSIQAAAKWVGAGKHEAVINLAGLAMVTVPNVDTFQGALQTREGETTADHRHLSDAFAAAIAITGLGVLASPHVAKLLLR
ncbi:MAG: hypothetical protein JWN41_1222 [Thermoleophilia bacterium]|nr:hypothetical protein [Thermoleophilia bacterium]